MKLMILRHGEAVPNFLNDDARELSDFGREQASAVGEFLVEQQLQPDLIAHSPLVRTTQTAALVNQQFGLQQLVVWPELSHTSSAIRAEQKLSTTEVDSLLLVSHMPLVAALQSYLVSADYTSARGFVTAELAVLETDEAFPGNWTLLQRYAQP